MLEEAHISNYHEGTEYVRSVGQQKYWITGISNALRSLKSKCVVCRKQIATGLYPRMSNLPSERTAENVFPFQNTGMDYFGPKSCEEASRDVCSLVSVLELCT